MNKKITFYIACFLFILSGVAALIYQVVWFKHLSYFMGNSSYSQAVVLATFMGGLAIGSWWWGKKSDTSKDPLLIFALLEVTIGLYCLMYVPIFNGVKNLFVNFVLSNHLAADSGVVMGLKVLASSSVILVPTILMGGTLPVLVKYLSKRIDEVGKNVSVLYFINSLGAVIGSVLAGFYLIGKFGLQTSTDIGASLDLFVGLAVLLYVKLNKKKQEVKTEDVKQVDTLNEVNYQLSSNQRIIVLAIAGFSGLSAMMYEVVWLRLLIPILSSTTHSFTLILTAFISGITIGSMIIYYFFPKIKDHFKTLAYCQLGIVLTVLLSVPFYEKLPYLIWDSIKVVESSELDYQKYLNVQFAYVFSLLLIPTIFMGMSLPLATKLLVQKVGKTGESVGKTFSVNTIGTVVGSLIAGLLFIPKIGIKSTMEMAMVINGALFIIAFVSLKKIAKTQIVLAAAATVFSVYIYVKSVNQELWATSIMTSDIPRLAGKEKAPKSYTAFKKLTTENFDKIKFYKEGIGGTVVVTESGNELALFTNGKCDGSSHGDALTQIQLAQIPLIMHPQPDSVFVIGLGTGQSIGQVASHPKVKLAQVAEISPEIVEASQAFNESNLRPLENDKVTLIKEDGVVALTISPYKYDIIISEPTNPWSAGMANLFTKEFFQLAKEKLHKNGILAQWCHLYDMNDATLRLVFRTIASEFKHLKVWKLNGSDLLIMGSNEPFDTNLKRMENEFQILQPYLAELKPYLTDFSSFLSQELISEAADIKKYSGQGILNTQDFPVLELWTPKLHYRKELPTEFYKIGSEVEVQGSNLLMNKYLATKSVSSKQSYDIGLLKSQGGKLGSIKFTNGYNRVQKQNKKMLPKASNAWSNNILIIGWQDETANFFPLDSIHPNQKLKVFSCCSKFMANAIITYEIEDPFGRVIIKDLNYDKNWTSIHFPLGLNHPLKEGTWKLRAIYNGVKISSTTVYVTRKATLFELRGN